MNMLTDSLPSTVTVSGRQYRIHTGYRNWIRFELLMLDRSIPIQRKVVEILKLVYAEELPPTLGEAMDAAFLFYARPKNEKTGAEERKKSKQVYSFAHDDEYIYVYAQTLENIEPPAKATDTNWMNLFISAGDTQHSFSGFNYVINRKPGQNGKTSVEKSKGGYDWQDAGEAEMYYSDNKIVYKIPLAAVGLTADNVQFSFKLADNVQKEDDILDYYVSGDCAPIGRFGYAYGK